MSVPTGAKDIAAYAAGAFGLLYLFSEWRFQVSKSTPFSSALKKLNSKDADVVEEGLETVFHFLAADKQGDEGIKFLLIDSGLHHITDLLLKEKASLLPSHVIRQALKILQKCAEEPSGRKRAARLGVVESLLRLLSFAVSSGGSADDTKMLEEIATTLAVVTTVDYKDIILEGDVPAGSECALRFLHSKHLSDILSMTATFDGHSTVFLQQMSFCFRNVSHLVEGAEIFHKSGAMSRFLTLLRKPVTEVKEHVLIVIYNMVTKHKESFEELISMSPVELFCPYFQPQHQKHATVIQTSLLIFHTLLTAATDAQKTALFEEMLRLELFDTLASIIGKDLPMQTRVIAEELLGVCLAEDEIHDDVALAIRQHTGAITKRKKLDQEEARRKKAEQAQQQRFFQTMAMKQMFGGGDEMDDMGMGGGGMDEMAAMQAMMAGMGMGM